MIDTTKQKLIYFLEKPNAEILYNFALNDFHSIKVSEYNIKIAEKDLQIHLDILPSAFINGNKMLVEKVFSNLIGNAIKYSPQRADIWISVLMKHEQIVFSVENAGVHIPENSIPRLFDAFYRVEQSRSRKTGGSGLGLYIVQEILHQYGSECTVCNTQAGVKFSFII